MAGESGPRPGEPGIIIVTVFEPGERPEVSMVDKRPRWEQIDQSRTDKSDSWDGIESQDM